MPTKNIPINKNGGHVEFEISSGYATRGRYGINLADDNGDYRELLRGDITDDIPDRIIIPINPTRLNNFGLIVIANYLTSPGRNQISVIYTFRQDGIDIDTTNITNSSVPIIGIDYVFSFQ